MWRFLHIVGILVLLFLSGVPVQAVSPSDSQPSLTAAKYELGISLGFPSLVAGAVGVRNILGSGVFSKIHWGGFGQAGELELGWSWGTPGVLAPFVSAFYQSGTWLLPLFLRSIVIVPSHEVGLRYGLVVWDRLVASVGLGYGAADNGLGTSLVLLPTGGDRGIILDVRAGVSLFF